MNISRDRIAQHYPHRVAMDDRTCPVCCGDRTTTDHRYAGAKVRFIEGIGVQVYECLACEIWEGTPGVDYPDPEEPDEIDLLIAHGASMSEALAIIEDYEQHCREVDADMVRHKDRIV